MATSGTLVRRSYNNFKGLDTREGEISLNRSPDALNLYRNYKSSNLLETRPDIELEVEFDSPVYGLFFYEVGLTPQLIVHSGTKLYKVVNGTKTELTFTGFTGMLPAKSYFFVYKNILYIKDGKNYLWYNGSTLASVINCTDNINPTHIPTTSISRRPNGGGAIYEDVNMLCDYRTNTFNADGDSTAYYLDAQNITGIREVKVNGVLKSVNTDYTVDLAAGVVNFVAAPEAPDTDGQDNVEITYIKPASDYKNRILKCTLLCVFDNRVFFSGNQDYPNVVWHSSLDDPTYVSDLDYYNEGLDLAKVKALIPGNNALWVCKEPSQANTTVFYHLPTIDAQYGKIYPSSHSSISTGCVGAGINFNDDICFFSDRGMEGVSGDITSEQVLAHRSTFIDTKLLKETNYDKMILDEWDGYLLVCIDNKIYLADSRQVTPVNGAYEYDWYYWELDKNIKSTAVKDGVLYIGCEDGLYTLTNTTNEVENYWTTPMDTFGYGNYQKITNKRGCIIECEGEEINVSVKTNKDTMTLIKTFENVSDYIIARIKRKKFKDMQIKVSSNTHMKLQSIMIESYIGAYVKR